MWRSAHHSHTRQSCQTLRLANTNIRNLSPFSAARWLLKMSLGKHTPTLDQHQHHHKHIFNSHSPNSFSNLFFVCFLQNFYKDINREGMYIRYLHSSLTIMCFESAACFYHTCSCIRLQTRTLVCVRFHNLTRDYMGLTELMSKSMGSALGLTGGRLEREWWDGLEEGKTWEKDHMTMAVAATHETSLVIFMCT